jgi:hypothetical protein
VEAFFEPHSSATGRKKSLHWGEKMFLGASKEFLNNFSVKKGDFRLEIAFFCTEDGWIKIR